MVFPLEAAFHGLRSLTTPFIQPLFVTLLYATIQNLGVLINIWANGDRSQDETDSRNFRHSRQYDFIIVGAGSSGSLLANRLSRHYTVLLLEAGGEPNPLQFIPGFGLFLVGYDNIDWKHRTVPQKYGSLNSVNQQSSWSTGLGLGGTGKGNLNLMIHLRGHRNDFDNWARILGDPQWSWENVREYFKRHEDYEIPGDDVNHGYRGDLRIERPDYVGRAFEFVRAGAELGYPNVDLNAPFVEGVDIIRYPIRNGVRQAPYKAFLEPIRRRQTLTIIKFAQVNKILFQNGNIAYGVQYDRHGRQHTAFASKEVLINAGTVGTPKLLMLSGIGPKHHLDELNIPVIADLPVGQNLQDHLAAYIGPFFIKQGLGLYLDRDLTPSEFVKWFTLGRGRLTSPGCEAVGIVSSDLAKARGEGAWPDLTIFQYSFTNFGLGPQVLSNGFNLKLDEMSRYLKNAEGRDSLYIVIQASRPLSRGYIKLGGSSPYDRPIIQPNYLSDPEQIDLQVHLDGTRKALELMENTTTMNRIEAQFTTTPLPGCEHYEFRSDLYWECFVRRFSITLHHPVGTASMGSVVDTELRVLGVRNLRVVDASVQPVIVTTNTQASTLMIAEKGADMILKHWKHSPTLAKNNRWKGPPVNGNVNFGGGNIGLGLNNNNLWAKSKRNARTYSMHLPHNVSISASRSCYYC